MYWYRQEGSNWLSDLWVCYWDGVECSGKAGDMHVSSLLLKSNGLSGIIPAEIGNLKYLTVLDLSDNLLVGELPKSLGQLSNLQTLKLRNNLLQGTISPSFTQLPSLQIFDIGNNYFDGSLPSGFSVDKTSISCSGNCFCSNETFCGSRRFSSKDDQFQCDPCA